MISTLFILLGLAAAAILVAGIIIIIARNKINEASVILAEAKDRLKNSKRDLEIEKRDALLKLKDEVHHKRKEFELELKRERLDLDRLQGKLNTKSESLEKRDIQLNDLRTELQQKERVISRTEDIIRANEQKIKTTLNDLIAKLEYISGISKEEAKTVLFDLIDSEVRLSTQKLVQKVEEDARQTAKERSTNIVVTAMQRYTADLIAPHLSGIVHLPNEEMKGRIIGKEGRNIKALEMSTGMEFIIGESSDITVSGFNPIRREIAVRTLEKLINDGRINPTRIEETVAQCEKEIEEIVQEYGKNAVLEFNLQGIHPEIVTLLGKLHFRTSYSQNVLVHSKEVGIFSRMIAEELGLDGSIALRAGLLHDIGKAVTAEVEGPHASIGGDIAKRCGETPIIVNAIAAHHEEVPCISIYSIIIMIADAISAARPGARRETLTAYIKRLEKLEEIANSFEGVKKVYAVQAGREIRVIVEENTLSDEDANLLAHNLARRVEQEMSFPGQIKINVIREKRSIEYAR